MGRVKVYSQILLCEAPKLDLVVAIMNFFPSRNAAAGGRGSEVSCESRSKTPEARVLFHDQENSKMDP